MSGHRSNSPTEGSPTLLGLSIGKKSFLKPDSRLPRKGEANYLSLQAKWDLRRGFYPQRVFLVSQAATLNNGPQRVKCAASRLQDLPKQEAGGSKLINKIAGPALLLPPSKAVATNSNAYKGQAGDINE